MNTVKDYLKLFLGALSPKRFLSQPVTTEAELAEFLATRSAYIAQTSLYGYLKTRMGTNFRAYFEDETFSAVILQSTTNLYASCLSDLTIFAVGLLADRTGLTEAEANQIAIRLFGQAIGQGVPEERRDLLPGDAAQAFEKRAETVNWIAAAKGEHAFAGSVDDLIRYAPIVDEYKKLDEEIVRNSIRFRWRDVRVQLRERLQFQPA